MAEDTRWPRKTRELHNHHFDSSIWNDLVFRDDDIIISTYAKSGTTWMQQIIGQLLFDADPDLSVAEMSPWLDLRVPPKEVKLPLVEAQTHRRFLKTHLPVDALVFSPRAKYIYIGRDGRDVVWSMYNHHVNANQSWYDALNETPGRVGPPIERPPRDVRDYWRDWLRLDGHPFWPFWENVRSWWEIRDLPNVKFVHFANLKRDMAAPDPLHRRVSRDSDSRVALGSHRSALFLRLDEEERHEERPAGRSVLGCRRGRVHPPGRQWAMEGHAERGGVGGVRESCRSRAR